jgi:hypothetical protein
MSRLRHLALVGTLLAAVTASPAHAQITVHTTLASWLASVTGAGLDTFNDLDIAPEEGLYESPLARTAGGFTYEASSEEGLYPSGSADDVWLSNFFIEDAVTLSAFSPSAFGVAGDFFLTDEFGQLGAQGALTISVESEGFSWTETLLDASSMQFIGFTSANAITSLRVAAIGASQENGIFATVNDVRVGGAPVVSVPEPGSLALLLTGAGGVMLVARRQRRLRSHTQRVI